MANYCDYKMKVKGRKEACYEWLNRMKSYDAPKHFFRMFDPIEIEEEGYAGNDYFMILSGYCAWSLES